VRKYRKPVEKIIIAGAGAASYRFLCSYRALNPTDQIHVFSKEKYPFYNRVLLPEYVNDKLSWDKLQKFQAFDVVHAEQLQALAQCEPARRHSVPIVLRCQNVESDLWSGAAASWPVLRALVRREAARLARHEGLMMQRVDAAIALTARDAGRLRELSGETVSIHHVPAPFPDRLPAGSERLAGDPAVVVLAGDWRPNRDGAAWLVERVWPDVLARRPRAVLHVFGSVAGARSGPAIVVHRSPGDSRAVFPPGAVLAVPLRFASGVRIKILEAWARGVPVVATPEAAAGLDAEDGEELLIAREPREFALAIQRVHADPAFALASVEAGRRLLRARHAPERIARQLAFVYGEVARRARP
jgi:glycosyltransferase involved in cell wall biosynthesis